MIIIPFSHSAYYIGRRTNALVAASGQDDEARLC